MEKNYWETLNFGYGRTWGQPGFVQGGGILFENIEKISKGNCENALFLDIFQ